jgi:hypothetical protein
MSTLFWPTCPRLHPGMMVPDDSQRYGHEWVCRACGTRLYGNNQGGADLPQISTERPTRDMGNLTGKPRNSPTHYVRSKERDRKHQGKWYQ